MLLRRSIHSHELLRLLLSFLLAAGTAGFHTGPGCDTNCQFPRRVKDEATFNSLNHHERSASIEEMNGKVEAIRKRRGQAPWDLSSNVKVQEALSSSGNATVPPPKYSSAKPNKQNYPNILFLLADDLGYGDLGVAPFVDLQRRTREWPCSEGGFITPSLQRMANNGAIMTNFHSASPVCSPSRVAILTGLYPWRLGALNAFELGQDLSQRNGFLPAVPTGPEILRGAGYYTGHSGKWHLGGMREEQRLRRVKEDNCVRPSPNQHGFEHYVSELDGPESARYTWLLANSRLHSHGFKHLLYDDVPMPHVQKPLLGAKAGDSPEQFSKFSVLSDREADDAIDMMRELSTSQPGQPFYIQVWFNAPHGPWETLKPGADVYTRHFNKSASYFDSLECNNGGARKEPLRETRAWQYKTMVTAMDRSIGLLLDALEELNIADKTLVVFTSDNGPEQGAGTAGIYREGKRSLLEGGIRVPAFFQWKGVIPAGSVVQHWGATIDLFPTFLHAAGVAKPQGLHWDGVSLLEQLLSGGGAVPGAGSGASSVVEEGGHHNRSVAPQGLPVVAVDSEGRAKSRLFLWHKDTERFNENQDRYQSSALFEDVKVTTTGRMGCVDRIFDMKHDPTEARNLARSDSSPGGRACAVNFDQHGAELVKALVSRTAFEGHCNKAGTHATKAKETACVDKYHRSVVAKVAYMLPHLATFVRQGDKPMRFYLQHERRGCLVPSVAEVPLVDFGKDCFKTKQCSHPMY